MRDESRFFVRKFTLLHLESGSAMGIKLVLSRSGFLN